MPHDLSDSWLLKLTGDGLYMLLQGSDRLQARMVPGASLILSGAPFADLNGAVIWGGEAPGATLETFAEQARQAAVPFLAILGPEVAASLAPLAKDLALVHATEFPIMVCEAAALTLDTGAAVEVQPVTDMAGMSDFAAPMTAAFLLDAVNTLRALPLQLLQGPVADGWVARLEGETVGCVTTTIHGDYVGIWAMATHPDHQRKGIGHSLLSQVMDHHRRRGAQRFFLGATPAGQPLYKKIGYVTRVVTQVWASGETAQA